MVSRNTSILLAVAIIAIGAVAIIGVAYAYTASTVNSDNTTTSEYVVLTQTTDTTHDTAKYSFGSSDIKYSTETSASGIKFTIASPTPETFGAYTVITLGSVALRATPTNETPTGPLSVDIDSDGLDAGDGWVYIISDGSHNAIKDSASDWSGNIQIDYTAGTEQTPATWNPTTVTLYYGYLTSAGGATAAPTNLTADDTITFTATFT